MTIVEYAKCVRKHWIIALSIPVVFLVATFMVLMCSQGALPKVYAASTTMVANSNLEVFYGLVSDEANKAMKANDEVNASVKLNERLSSVDLSVTGEDADLVEQIAKTIQDDSVVAVEEYLAMPNGATDGNASSSYFKATDGEVIVREIDPGGYLKLMAYCGFAFIFGLFVSVSLIIILVACRKPIVDLAMLERECALPIIMRLTHERDAERLINNLQLYSRDEDSKMEICLVPLSDNKAADEAHAMLSFTLANMDSVKELESSRKDLCFVATSPLSDTLSGAFLAKDASLTLVVAREWDDTLTSLSSCMNELGIADADVAGIVLLNRILLSDRNGQSK